jgi:U4/U6 small nuclear ribonucleoprotein PRP31
LRKALPKPDDKPRKKRGGKKFRKQKERFAMTEQRKMANIVPFGTEA